MQDEMLHLLRHTPAPSFYSSLASLLSIRCEGTRKAYLSIMRRLAAWAEVEHGSPRAAKVLAGVDVRQGLQFLQTIKASGNSEATIQQRIAGLVAIWDGLQAAGEVKANPWREIYKLQPRREPEQVRPTGTLTPEQVRAMLEAPDRGKSGIRDRALLALLFGAALRRSEARNLQLGDILDGGLALRIKRQKSGGAAIQPVANFAQAAIRDLVTQRQAEGATATDYFLVAYSSLGQPRKRIRENLTWEVFRHYASIAGATAAPHAARAAAITKLLESGTPIADVAEFARHAAISTTCGYDKREKGRVAKKVAGKLNF